MSFLGFMNFQHRFLFLLQYSVFFCFHSTFSKSGRCFSDECLNNVYFHHCLSRSVLDTRYNRFPGILAPCDNLFKRRESLRKSVSMFTLFWFVFSIKHHAISIHFHFIFYTFCRVAHVVVFSYKVCVHRLIGLRNKENFVKFYKIYFRSAWCREFFCPTRIFFRDTLDACFFFCQWISERVAKKIVFLNLMWWFWWIVFGKCEILR